MMMFVIQKARSRTNEVEYLEISLEQIKDYLIRQEAPMIQTDGKKKLEKHLHEFPLTEKSTLRISKLLTKGKKILKSISITLEHIAWYDVDRPVKWTSGITYNPDMKFQSGFNYNSFDVYSFFTERDDNKLYIVFDLGFNADNMNREPYFLEHHQFNYVYERI